MSSIKTLNGKVIDITIDVFQDQSLINKKCFKSA
jgi:hypothetical protein